MKYNLFLCFFLVILLPGKSQLLEEKFRKNQSYSHEEIVDAYQLLDKSFKKGKLIEYGETDIGRNLHLFVINSKGQFDPSKIDHEKEVVFFINNAIHPGESCGVDASLKFAYELLDQDKIPDGITLCIIPMYNIGGALNRGCCSRANQNGPEEYGFRGNAKNLDLNRDFIKCDSENAKSFSRIFHLWQPDIFMDTHTTNGADYPYSITLISSQFDKAEEAIALYTKEKIEPVLYAGMEKSAHPMCPYMYSMNRTPSSGIKAFLETPRYSSGYASLFGCFSFISEAHMLKTFEERVLATHRLIEILYSFAADNRKDILTIRQMVKKSLSNRNDFDLQWELDTNKEEKLELDLFEEVYEPSSVTGHERLRYDTNKRSTVEVPYFPYYVPTVMTHAPEYYVIPQAWKSVIERLKLNGVEMHRLTTDKVLDVEASYIATYETLKSPYEGHYGHHDVHTIEQEQKWQYYQGDYIIKVNQLSNRYIVETLEPRGVDSYFAWGFFDAILQQKEWFSDYVFEESVKQMLKNDAELEREFEQMKEDPDFSENHFMQLYWLYQRSPNFENTKNRYPITRIRKATELPIELEQ